MSKSIRIRTTPNGDDAYLKVKLDQDFDFIEILSLKISQEEVYSRFCSDYGVVVGRIIINNGFGVPNAKVSIFVPISDEDDEDSEISGLYPFKNLTDTDDEGVRYNLLQKDSKPQDPCFTPVGTFPAKREVIDNGTVLEVYDKYYKFTTTTNDAGDFMLFGVPVGTHVINVDADLSDIGILSQRPYDYINQGEPSKRFETPTKFKGDKDLDKLIQIKNFKKGVNVQPFWGDVEQCDIGISRVDLDLKKNIIPSAIFMGSIFSDSEKNSVNKNCRPRKDLGRICETTTSEGTIEMIRKTLDGTIERFDVEGGRVINDWGTWAYQIPMNLDYMVTNEFGDLIPSEDPTKGIPTKTRVRFRIGMDITGDEGRLRTTAKYLVPHNPADSTDIDYNFNENTNDNHFRDLHWNKIYSVSNFIPRLQAGCSGSQCSNQRNITGIKDVDDCVGLRTQFPFNRVDTDINPLFSILCIIISIMTLIIWLINSTIVLIINSVLKIINEILEIICKLIFAFAKAICGPLAAVSTKITATECRESACMGGNCSGKCKSCECTQVISYVPCIVLDCDEEEYAPGCNCNHTKMSPKYPPVGETDTGSTGIAQLGCFAARANLNNPKKIDHWSGLNPNKSCSSTVSDGGEGHDGHNTVGAGYSDCQAIILAEKLNLFELDFYNDWVNGTLYTYLLKYKKKNNGKRKFCDSGCEEGDSDNGCNKSFFVDSCIGDTLADSTKYPIDEGFVKLVTQRLPNGLEEENLYYAPHSRNTNFKLFATDLIHLGSIFQCDWEGIPRLQSYLIPTTYKRPPYTDENLGSDKLVCGMTSTGFNNPDNGVFFDVDCVGLTVGNNRCDNIKRQCEIGVGLDEAILSNTNQVISQSDCQITDDEIDNIGNIFRQSFYALNSDFGPNKFNSFANNKNDLMVGNIDTGFNGTEYLNFRNNSISHTTPFNRPPVLSYTQPSNSYYFYFGAWPGRSAIDIMNRLYFTECIQIVKNDFTINLVSITNVTTVGGNDGEIDITVIGGSGDYTYVWTGPNGYSVTETTANGDDGDIQGLEAGVYTVVVTDSNGGTSTATYTVSSPVPFQCEIIATDATQAGGDGSISISVFGGQGPYSYTINGGSSTQITSYDTVLKPEGNYTVVVTDGNGSTCSETVDIFGPPALSLGNGVTSEHTTCGKDNGEIKITIDPTIIGGQSPYSFEITNSSGTIVGTTSLTTGLPSGTYTVEIMDSSNPPQTYSQTITIKPSNSASIIWISDKYCWVNTNPTINPSFNISSNGGGSISWESFADDGTTLASGTKNYNSGVSQVNFSGSEGIKPNSTEFTLVDDNDCFSSVKLDFRKGEGYVPSTQMTTSITLHTTPVIECKDGDGNVTRNAVNGSIQGYASGGWGSHSVVKWQYKNGSSGTVNNYNSTSNPLTLSSGNGSPSLDRYWRALMQDAEGCQKYTPWKSVKGPSC